MDNISGKPHGLSLKIIRNTIFNTAGRMWGILASFLLTPYILHSIGVERFAIWAVVGVLTGYFGLLDFGIGSSFVKYIAEFYARKEYDNINDIISTGVILYLFFSTIIMLVAFLTVGPLLSLFKIPHYLYGEAKFVLILGIAIFGVSNTFSSFGSIQGGLQRMDISNKFMILLSVVNILGVITFLHNGYGLSGLMVNNAIITIIASIGNVIIGFRLLPQLRCNIGLCTRAMFKKLFSFGYKIQVVRISGLVGMQTDKLLIAYFLNLKFVTFYQLGGVIVEQAKWLCLLGISAIIPTISELNALKDLVTMRSLYLKSVKYLTCITVVLCVFLILNARRTIAAWMNQDLVYASLSLQVLLIGFFINILTGPGWAIAQGIAKPEYLMRTSLIQIVLNPCLTVPLIMKFGFMGALVGTSLSVSFTSIYFIYLVNKILRISLKEIFGALPLLFVSCIPGTLLNIFIGRLFPLTESTLNRFYNSTVLFGNFLIFFGMAFGFLYLARYFDNDDKRIFKQTMHAIFLKGKGKYALSKPVQEDQ